MLVNGQMVTATVSGSTWSAAIPVALADGIYGVQVTVSDNAGNQATTTSTGALTIDTTAPTATVTSLVTNDTTPTITGTVADASPSSGIAAVSVVVNGQTVTATLSGSTWSATIPVALADGIYDVQVTVSDKAGNQATTTATGALTIDTVAPTVSGVSTTAAANSTFNLGQSISILVTFNEAINVTGTPRLSLNDTGVATYSSGSGTSTLTFTYTIGLGQNTSDLDYLNTTALALNGGTIRDLAGNTAVLTLPATGTDGLATQDITIVTPTSDIAVTMTVSSAKVLPGGAIGYTITVTNNGPNDASAVTLSDTLPAGLTFGVQKQTSGPTFSLSHNGNTISGTIATLASGAAATIVVVADVGLSTASGAVFTNTATVATSSVDPTSQNNTATVSSTAIMTGVMLTPDPLDASKNELVVGGTVKADSVSFLSAAGGKVSVTMDGKSYGSYAVTGRLVAYGQTGNDLISVAPTIHLDAYLYAGSGNCQLVGGAGNNVLVGGSGANVLIGGPGHNLLIAGTGPSKLYSTRVGVAVGANSGSILIGGTTDFDHNDAALAAIMQEWGSGDTYATKVSKIKTGVGAGFALSSTTVHQTAAHDQLFASTGMDWFLAPSAFDQVLGVSAKKKSLIQIN